MAEVLISNAALKEMSKLSFLPFKYIALDSSATAYDPATQSAPITEITTGGGGRGTSAATHDREYGREQRGEEEAATRDDRRTRE